MKNEVKVKSNGWEARYYYLRFSMIGDVIYFNVHGVEPNIGVASVCTMKLKGNGNAVFTRGISFWPGFGFRKAAGRNVALGRAIVAAEQVANIEPIIRDTHHARTVKDIALKQIPEFSFMAEYDPALTDYEKKLFAPAKE